MFGQFYSFEHIIRQILNIYVKILVPRKNYLKSYHVINNYTIKHFFEDFRATFESLHILSE